MDEVKLMTVDESNVQPVNTVPLSVPAEERELWRKVIKTYPPCSHIGGKHAWYCVLSRALDVIDALEKYPLMSVSFDAPIDTTPMADILAAVEELKTFHAQPFVPSPPVADLSALRKGLKKFGRPLVDP